MNTIFLRKGVFCLSSLATFAILSSGSYAVAQTVDTLSSQPLTEPSATVAADPTQSTITEKSTPSNFTEVQHFPNADTQQVNTNRIFTPVPGTVETSSAALVREFAQPASQESQPSQPAAPTVAQSDIDLGRTTRGGSSYIGVAGNIGLGGGDSSLSDGNIAVISKVGLTNAFSLRPSAVFGDNTTILIPVTYDFSFQQADAFSEPLPIAPYVGVGAAIKTGDDSQVAVLVTGGIDVPLTSQFTATAAVNAGFFDQTDVGFLVGVGYNFTGF